MVNLVGNVTDASKSWMKLLEFHFTSLMTLGKVCDQLFSLQLCVNSRKDETL